MLWGGKKAMKILQLCFGVGKALLTAVLFILALPFIAVAALFYRIARKDGSLN
jgi:hypothetical protein